MTYTPTVLHIVNDLHKASPAELIAYAVAGPHVIETAPEDVDAYAWAAAAMVLIEVDAAPVLVEHRGLFHRGHVTLVAHDPCERHLWVRAQQVGAQKVIFLPEDTRWLIEEIRHTCQLEPA